MGELGTGLLGAGVALVQALADLVGDHEVLAAMAGVETAAARMRRPLPEPVREVIVGAFDHAMQGVFVAGIPIAVIGLVAVSFMKGVPLRGGGPERRRR